MQILVELEWQREQDALVELGKAKKAKEQGGLGFRDAYIFNVAMLAKQSWRLLQNLDFLCVTILNTKYYRHGDLLKAKPNDGMPYKCRSV